MYKKGYTVIELILVISIVGILATVALPIYRKSMAYHRHSMAVRMIVSDIRLIQQQTITEKQSGKYKLIFSLDSSNYLLDREGRKESRQLPEGNRVIRTNLENDILRFNPFGELASPLTEPSKGGTITIKDNSGKNESTIVVIQATGKVEISGKDY